MGELMANLYVDDPLMENLFFHCAECNMPVIIHIAPSTYGYYGIIDELGLPRLEKIIKKYPKLKILGHSQPFWAEIGNDVTDENRNSYPEGKVKEGRIVKLMREYENLYGDMSAGSGFNAISRDPEFGYRFIEEFKDKLFFGTDICAPHNNMLLSHWLDKAYEEKNISEDAYRKISRENAIKILGL
jgi:predicted TIM-barrel fold metal-dependent hydrolase